MLCLTEKQVNLINKFLAYGFKLGAEVVCKDDMVQLNLVDPNGNDDVAFWFYTDPESEGHYAALSRVESFISDTDEEEDPYFTLFAWKGMRSIGSDDGWDIDTIFKAYWQKR